MSTSSTNGHPGEPQAASNGCKANGRFAVGNPGGPGNPFARQVAGLRQALLNGVTADDLQCVARKLVELAKDGNVQAAKLLLSYTIGKPQPAPEPDRMDVDEWEGYRETAGMKTETAEMAAAGAPEHHLSHVRILRPLISSLNHEQLMNEVVNPKPAPVEKHDAFDEADFEKTMAEILNGATVWHPPSTNGKNTPRRSRPTDVDSDHPTPQPPTNGRMHVD